MTTTSYRLPRTFCPKAYRIALTASPRRVRFVGTIALHGTLRAACPAVELHARGLRISAARLRQGGRWRAARLRLHPERETVELFAADLQPGELQLEMRFAGQLGTGMHGLYLACDGPERALVSQCEASDARAIFPCLDEPDFKATFAWEITTDDGLEVITNGVQRRRRKVPGKAAVVHSFAPTRVMSTYLCALSIGAYEAAPANRLEGVRSRLFAGRGKAAQTAFARQVTDFVVPYHARYFAYPYPYAKLDQVAVPGFDAGAMENVGAIFYRQSLLLMQEGSASWAAQKRIAEVIAHETAHQWFGNLVTMAWWDDLWLNEAFATLTAYKACDTWRPQWRIWDDFLASKDAALSADALTHTHPVYTAVQSPAEATELFDVITYEKGCAILRMVESFMGEAAFRRGIRAYIKAFADRNARGADLWEKLDACSPAPVGEMMRGWIAQPGFPLLQCRISGVKGAQRLHLRQQRFSAQAEQGKTSADKALWLVPAIVQIGTDKGVKSQRLLLKGRSDSFALPPGNVAWLYPNAQATGFYRVELAPRLLRALLRDGLTELAPAARMALVADQWALLRAGRSPAAQFFSVLAAYREERDHAVTGALISRLYAVISQLLGARDAGAWGAFVAWLLQPQRQELGDLRRAVQPATKPEQAPHKVRHATVLGALAELGRDPEILRQAGELVGEEMRAPHALDANLASTVVALAALRGNVARLRTFVKVYQERRDAGAAPQLHGRYLQALSLFEAPEAVRAVLKMCADGTIAQEQVRTVLGTLLSRRRTQAIAWQHLRDNWQALRPRLGGMGIARLVEATGALPPGKRAEVKRFFAAHPVPEASRALRNAQEAMQLRAALQTRCRAEALAWLAQHRARHGYG